MGVTEVAAAGNSPLQRAVPEISRGRGLFLHLLMSNILVVLFSAHSGCYSSLDLHERANLLAYCCHPK
jgi:hypothetical protein